ncbi:hypothetical protein GCM10027445_52970 [Amycolatopsis endophytica]
MSTLDRASFGSTSRRAADPTADDFPSSRSPRPLPVAPVRAQPKTSGIYFTATPVDNRGRLADRSPLRVLGWAPKTQVTFTVRTDGVLVAARSPSPYTVTQQGHLRLPAAMRHALRLSPGVRVLVVVLPGSDHLAMYTAPALEALVLPRVQPETRP